MPQLLAVQGDADHGADRQRHGHFPVVTMRLLGFVALWGMILMPMGAVIFVDFWLLGRYGGASATPPVRDLVQLGRGPGLAADDRRLHRPGRCRGQIFFVSLPGFLAATLLAFLLSKWLSPAAAKPSSTGAAL